MMIMMHKVNIILFFYIHTCIIYIYTYKLNLLFSILGEANKLITDYRYKLQKAEQEIASLQASLKLKETQVIRYKSTADASEKAESELKIERRKLQREVS